MNQPVTGVPQMLPTQVIDTSTDSREILKHARLAARRRNSASRTASLLAPTVRC